MKKRIIVGIVAAITATTLCTMVAVQWHAQGCGWQSLIAGMVFYTACVFGLWITIDNKLKED